MMDATIGKKIETILMTYRSAIPYLTAFGVITVMCMLVHLEVQQSMRQSANDPQIQMAEDMATALASGKQVSLGSDKLEISESLAPYLMVFDNQGVLTSSNALLDGRAPVLPRGVLDWVRQNGEDRISWQPRSGVRSALVIVAVKGGGGFVAAGRSLREVERREAFAFQAAAGVWAVLTAAVFLCIFIYHRAGRRDNFAGEGRVTASAT